MPLSTARAQDSEEAPIKASARASASSSAEADTERTPHDQWLLGAYYRHDWIPSYMLSMFLSRAPSITNDGFGITISHRSAEGFTAQLGIGYMPYKVSGAFTADNTLVEDTEFVKSDLALIHVTGSLLWPIELTQMLTLEFGFGLDIGALTGSVIRSEAYPDPKGHFHPCSAAGDPNDPGGPDKGPDGVQIKYCAQAFNGNNQPIASNTASEKGEQYHVRENRIPAIMAFPMLPHLALRFAPWERVAFKLEFAFGVAQIWAGASVHVAFTGVKSHAATAPEVVPAAPAAPASGRVLGKLMAKGSNQPIVGATIRSPRVLSVIASDERGLFIVDKVDPGELRFEITHPDYQPSHCSTTIPAEGGEVALHCFLIPLPTEGAISGVVKDEHGSPVGAARITITGPAVNGEVLSSKEGLFALPDAPPGTYRLRVDADGYLMQLVGVEVTPRETTLPEILLIAKPKSSLVTLKASEIAIKQQINFEVNSAAIGESSNALMNEIADVLLRHDEIEQLEIQGHTDNKGGQDHNLELSQARAESVRDFLVHAGVASERLRARGYGQDMPLVPNTSAANRAKNRRVQFIIVH